jgi:hypothetical protein
MTRLDRAIQGQKPNLSNQNWMAGSSPAMTMVLSTKMTAL